MADRLTMDDIATRANVSRSTVSRVLSGESVVADETAERVRALAAELGYRPRTWRRKTDKPAAKTGRIVIINKSAIDGGSIAAMHCVLVASLNAAGYTTDLYSDEADAVEALDGAVGLITTRVPESRKLIAAAAKLPGVQLLGMPMPSGPSLDVVTYDYYMVGGLAAHWLADQGCRHIAMVAPRNPVADIRARSFREQGELAGCQVSVFQSDLPALNEADAIGVVDRLRASETPIDGLFGFNDHVILTLYPLLLAAGLKPGSALKLIGCDAESFLSALSPRPATIDIHLAELAKRAAEVLLWRMENRHEYASTVMLRPTIVDPGEAGDRALNHVSASNL